MIIKYLIIASLLVVFTGCNQSAKDVRPSNVSIYKYQHRSCDTLKLELYNLLLIEDNIASDVDSIKERQDFKMYFAWLFWPSYLIIDDNKDAAYQLSKVRGNISTINSVILYKKCNN
jgi:hypothetical protein